LELVSSFVSFHQKIRRLLQFWIFRAPSRPDNLGFVQFQKLRPYRPGRTRKKMGERKRQFDVDKEENKKGV
jgi:hypothetical protein